MDHVAWPVECILLLNSQAPGPFHTAGRALRGQRAIRMLAWRYASGPIGTIDIPAPERLLKGPARTLWLSGSVYSEKLHPGRNIFIVQGKYLLENFFSFLVPITY